MSRLTSQNRKYLIAGAGVCAIALAALGLGLVYPPKGPISATMAPQSYVEYVTDGEIPQRGPYVLVDAASARLFMIENGRVEGSMKVIVGKPGAATPALKSVLNSATLNPYWNVPTDLARTIIAPRVVKDGNVYLTDRGYQIMNYSSAGATVVSPDSVDWPAVADGRAIVHVRQLPGPYNSMGHLKFSLARADGIFLHDTPHKELFSKPERSLSNGCVRLEDAPKFARWLIGHEPKLASTEPEQRVALSRPVPITIAYLDSRAQMKLAGLQ